MFFLGICRRTSSAWAPPHSQSLGSHSNPSLGMEGNGDRDGTTSALPTTGKTNPEQIPASEGEAAKRSLLFSTEPTLGGFGCSCLWIWDLESSNPSVWGWEDGGGGHFPPSQGVPAQPWTIPGPQLFWATRASPEEGKFHQNTDFPLCVFAFMDRKWEPSLKVAME